MRKLLLIGLCFSFAMNGCGGDSSADADESAETPERVARRNARTAQEELRDSDKGVDESGDRLWKQEARAFFDFKKHPANRTFELPVDWARDFVETAYAAGAQKVWVTSISEISLGDSTFNVADNLVVVLPSDAAGRRAILTAYNDAMSESGMTPLADVGQDYLFISGD